MPYPITASINEGLRTPRDRSPKAPINRSSHAHGFVTRTFPSIGEFVEAISASPTHHGPGFAFGEFEQSHRRTDNFKRSYGQGIDFDKIVRTTGDTESIDWDECAARLPTTESLLNSRLGSFIRVLYQSSSCPDDAPYFMGRAVISYEEPLNLEEQKAFGAFVAQLLCEDFPQVDPKVLEKEGLRGGIDTGAIKNAVCWWAGLKHGRTPCFVDETVPPIPKGLMEGFLGTGREYVRNYSARTESIERLELDEETLEAFATLISEVLELPGPGTYDSVFCWVKSFVQQTSPALDSAFEDWVSKSSYRMQRIGNPMSHLRFTKPMDYANLGTMFRAMERGTPGWREKYHQVTGKHLWFTNSSDLQISDHHTMGGHAGDMRLALAALGL